jgi:N-hydroxyarylamine O-acetyltransferase
VTGAARAAEDQYHRYLRLLGFGAPPTPDLDGLRAVVGAHLIRVPFENVSKLLQVAAGEAGRPTTLGAFLEGIEERDLGGTCYTNNPFLCELLGALGYDATLLGAGMTSPNVHAVIRVRIDGAAFHVDVGYAAPFRAPISLDDLPASVAEGRLRYDLAGNPESGYHVAVMDDRTRLHGYRVNERPRDTRFFDGVVRDSFRPEATFMRCLRIKRYFPDRAVDLHNGRLSIHRAGVTQTRFLVGLADLEAAVVIDLGMPRCPIGEAVGVLERLTGSSIFDAVEGSGRAGERGA